MIETDRTLFTRRTLIVAIGFVLAFAAFMYLLDRPAWCDQGFGLWTGAATGCTSQHLLDPYTLSHISAWSHFLLDAAAVCWQVLHWRSG